MASKRATGAPVNSQKNPLAALAAPIIPFMKFVDLHLIAVNAGRFPKFDSVKKLNVPFHPTQEMEVSYDPEKRAAIAMVRLTLDAGQGDDQLMHFEAFYRVVYLVKAEFKDDEIAARAEAFCRAHSLAHVWPYWRELLASMCVKMQLPPVLAPLLLVGSTASRVPAVDKPTKKAKS